MQWKKYVVKKTVYDEIVTKINAIDNRGFILKTQYNNDKPGIERKMEHPSKKIPNTSGLVKK